MRAFLTLRNAMIVLGVIAFTALIGFAGPLLAIGDVRPLESLSVRVAVIAAVLLLFAGAVTYAVIRRRKSAERLERGLTEAEEENSDAAVLQETVKDALATLRKASAPGGDYLY